MAKAHFELLLKEFPKNDKACAELKKTEERIIESESGRYDIARLYRESADEKKRYLDAADYAGPVQVVTVSGKGKRALRDSRKRERFTQLCICATFR